jgi:thiamine-phosphate pyrophosphorylase
MRLLLTALFFELGIVLTVVPWSIFDTRGQVRPVLCLITDRRWSSTGTEDDLVARVGAAARAGVELIQVRERDLEGGPLTRLVARCVDAVRQTRARIVVNERTDVALAAGAHGVHLRGDSLPASRVRAIVPAGFLIGRSVHSVAEVQTAAVEGAIDYLLFGTVFPTASKAGRPAAGTSVLAAAVSATAIPVLAVGGQPGRPASPPSGCSPRGRLRVCRSWSMR